MPKSKRKSKTKGKSEGNTDFFLCPPTVVISFLSPCPATNPENGRQKNELSPQANDNNTENGIIFLL